MHMRIVALCIRNGHNRNDANEEIISSTCNMEFRLFAISITCSLSLYFVFFSFFRFFFQRVRALQKKRERARRKKLNKKPIQKKLNTKNAWYMECGTRPLPLEWRTTRLYCYFGICWLTSAGKCLFYVWTENINTKVILHERKNSERKRERGKRK